MSTLLTPVSDAEEIRQGDVIRRIEATSGIVTWGVIVTADCDIARKKTGERYTWLEIVSIKAYLEGIWAEEQLRQMIKKQARISAEAISVQIRKQKLSLNPLHPESLSKWLSTATAEEVLSAVSKTVDSKQLAALQALRLAHGYGTNANALSRFTEASKLLGRTEKNLQDLIREALNSGGGFPDFFVLPELPNTPDLGFVVLLRAVSSLSSGNLFLTEVDARINDRPGEFHRIGRFSDGLRFAITQKLAFLFSRIGMPTTFEDACSTATDLAIEALFRAPVKQGQP